MTRKYFPSTFIDAWPLGALLLALAACSSSPHSAPAQNDGGSAGASSGLNLVVPVVSCPDASTLVRSPGACVPLQHRDFATEIVPLFDGCAGEVCHNFGGGAIAGLIGVLEPECCKEIPVIDPGHPETSYVLDKLSGRNICAGARMPLERPPLAAQDLQAISDWICQGADTK